MITYKILINQSMNPILDELFSSPLDLEFVGIWTTLALNKSWICYSVEVWSTEVFSLHPIPGDLAWVIVQHWEFQMQSKRSNECSSFATNSSKMSCVSAQSLSHVQLFAAPMDCSPPGSSVHGISQARVLEWVAIPFFRESSQPQDRTCVSWIGRQILYHWATCEAPQKWHVPIILIQHSVGSLKWARKITFCREQSSCFSGRQLPRKCTLYCCLFLEDLLL